MSGHWRIDPSEIGKHDHFVIETDEGRRLALNDAAPLRLARPRARPTSWTSGRRSRRSGPSRSTSTRASCRRRLAGRTAPIKLLLLDQRIVAGLGNIYVCEALYRAGIHPARAGGSISLGRLERLVPAIHDVLAEAIAAGGSTLRDFASPDGELGYFSEELRGLWPRRASLAAAAGPVEADRPGRPLDLLLPDASCSALTFRRLSRVGEPPRRCEPWPRRFSLSYEEYNGEHAASQEAHPPQRESREHQPFANQPHPDLRQAGRSRRLPPARRTKRPRR